jgi:uncharacterized membrane protein YjgN (DUF898 family)
MDLETAPPAAPAIESYRLKFSGDGGVYFGVWGVNLLLMVVTLGLFTPFARRRKIKYFYAHTVVAGSPLEFTGGLRRMFIGYLLFFGLYLAYSIAAQTEQQIAAGAIGLGWLLLAPWLWASAQRFRLASTRWRGIRGQFTASWGQAYAASWPLLLLVLAGAAIGAGTAALRGTRPGALAVLGGALGFLLVVLLLFIRLEFNYTRLYLTRCAFGGQPGRWKGAFGDFVRFSAAAVGVYFALAAVLFGLIALAVYVTGGFALLGTGLRTRTPQAILLFGSFALASVFAIYFAAGPALAYREARKFALVWNNAGLGHVARFRCDLRPWPFVWLRVKNIFMTLITLGFWRPFAVTSEYRMKVESVTLHVKGGLDQLVGQLTQQQGAFADAIADAVGFDVVG